MWWAAWNDRVLLRTHWQPVLMQAAQLKLVELTTNLGWRFPPPVPLYLSTLISPELLSLHLHQGLPRDRERCKDLIPLIQARGLEPESCHSLEEPSE